MKLNKSFFSKRDPLRILIENYNKTKLSDNRLGAILARAGIGKTALIVQLAIDTILKNKKVLHISLGESVEKVSIWYKEVLNNLTLLCEPNEIDLMSKLIQLGRFIIAPKTDNLTTSILDERLKNLIKQKIFKPDVIIIDGIYADKNIKFLENLKDFSIKNNLDIWVTMTIHRSQDNETKNIMKNHILDLNLIFSDIICLNAKNDKIYIETLKGYRENHKEIKYLLDPSTMLIKKC